MHKFAPQALRRIAIQFMLLSTQLVCAAILLCAAGATRAETLAEGVARAIERFPDFRAALADRRAADAVTEQARGALLPSIDASLGSGFEDTSSPSRTFGRETSLERQEAALTLTHPLADGGAARGQVRRFGALAGSSAYRAAGAAETVAARTGLAYLEVLRLRAQIVIAEQSVQAHQTTLRRIELLAEGGAGRRSDVQQAAARHGLSEATLTQLRGQLAQALAAYRHLAGEPGGELRTPASFENALPASLADALGAAASTHPVVKAAEQELVASRANRDSARARLAPRLNLELGLSNNRNVDGISGPVTDRFAMLRLRYNLYRGGSDEQRVRETEARIDEALARLAGAKNDVERDLRQAWEVLAADRARMPQLAIHAQNSAQVMEAYRIQFQIGQRSLLDVLNAENELFSARGAVVNGLFAVLADELRVLAGMGRLLATLEVPLPPEAVLETPSP